MKHHHVHLGLLELAEGTSNFQLGKLKCENQYHKLPITMF